MITLFDNFWLYVLGTLCCTLLGPHYRTHSTWDPRRHLYEELSNRRGSNETIHTHRGKNLITYRNSNVGSVRDEDTNIV